MNYEVDEQPMLAQHDRPLRRTHVSTEGSEGMEDVNARRRQDVGASAEHVEVMDRRGREEAIRDLLDGFPVGDARDRARAFLREGDYESARYWMAYAETVRLTRVVG